jgi:hypothetical protein
VSHSLPSGAPVKCSRCHGCGQDEVGSPCGLCDGFGHYVTQGDSSRARLHCSRSPVGEPTQSYICTSGEDVIDYGLTLAVFVGELQDAWPELEEDLAVWLLEDGRGPRLIAVLHPGRAGETVVRYL